MYVYIYICVCVYAWCAGGVADQDHARRARRPPPARPGVEGVHLGHPAPGGGGWLLQRRLERRPPVGGGRAHGGAEEGGDGGEGDLLEEGGTSVFLPDSNMGGNPNEKRHRQLDDCTRTKTCRAGPHRRLRGEGGELPCGPRAERREAPLVRLPRGGGHEEQVREGGGVGGYGLQQNIIKTHGKLIANPSPTYCKLIANPSQTHCKPIADSLQARCKRTAKLSTNQLQFCKRIATS